MDTNDVAVSTGEAARRLGWSPDTLRRWADTGVLPSDALELSPGGHRRFHIGIIRRWSQERAQHSVSERRRRMLLGEARWQAEKLRSYVRRGGDAAQWWKSKGFAPEMRAAIEQALAGHQRGDAE